MALSGATRKSRAKPALRTWIAHVTKTAEKGKDQEVTLGPSRGVFGPTLEAQVRQLAARAADLPSAKPLVHMHLDPAMGEASEEAKAAWWARFEADARMTEAGFVSVRHKPAASAGIREAHEHRLYEVRDDLTGGLANLGNNFYRNGRISVEVAYDHGERCPPIANPVAAETWLRANGREAVADWLHANYPRLPGPGRYGPKRVADLSPADRQQQDRTGVRKVDVGAAAWSALQQGDSGPARAAALRDRGLTPYLGDEARGRGKRVPVVRDEAGGVTALVRAINVHLKGEGQKPIVAADLARLLKGADLPHLPAKGERPAPTRKRATRSTPVTSPAPAASAAVADEGMTFPSLDELNELERAMPAAATSAETARTGEEARRRREEEERRAAEVAEALTGGTEKPAPKIDAEDLRPLDDLLTPEAAPPVQAPAAQTQRPTFEEAHRVAFGPQPTGRPRAAAPAPGQRPPAQRRRPARDDAPILEDADEVPAAARTAERQTHAAATAAERARITKILAATGEPRAADRADELLRRRADTHQGAKRWQPELSNDRATLKKWWQTANARQAELVRMTQRRPAAKLPGPGDGPTVADTWRRLENDISNPVGRRMREPNLAVREATRTLEAAQQGARHHEAMKPSWWRIADRLAWHREGTEVADTLDAATENAAKATRARADAAAALQGDPAIRGLIATEAAGDSLRWELSQRRDVAVREELSGLQQAMEVSPPEPDLSPQGPAPAPAPAPAPMPGPG